MRAFPAILMILTMSLSEFGLAESEWVPLVNIPGNAAKLPEVKGIAVDASGNVFFAAGGYYSYSVLRWDAGTGMLTTAAGNGTPGFSGDGGPASSAQLDGVTDIALDRAGNLYLADANNGRVRKVSNGIITTVAGGGSSLLCDKCPATSANLAYVTAIAIDPIGDLYLFTSGLVFKASNGLMTKVLSSAGPCPDGGICAPGSAAVDSAGNLYVADFNLHRVRKLSNGVVTTVAGTGTAGFSGDNGPATSAQLAGPRGVAVDASGNLYIADTGNQRIRKVSDGIITTVAGGGSPSEGLGDNGPATGGLLNYPFGVGVDSTGNFYIQDTLDNRIRKVANGTITTVAGGGSTPVLLARSAGAFTTTSLTAGRNQATATLLNDGKVLVAGGYVYPSFTDSAELYDPSTGTFSATGNMTSALRQISSATLLPDGKVLIAGAASPDRSTTQLYDPANAAFTAGASPLNISRPVTATLLDNGKVLITGGSGTMPGALTNYAAELYDPLTGGFTSAGKMSRAHTFPSATLLPDGKVLLAEGHCGSDLSGNELYDPGTGTFSAIAETPSCISVGPVAVLLANGQVLIGGTLYDPAAGTFTPGPDVVQWGNTATLLTDGTVLSAGGEPLPDGDFGLADAYLRDPATGTLGLTGFMTVPRGGAQATYLPDGTVLLTGGVMDNPNRGTVEIYEPPVLTRSPVLFPISGDGRGQGAIWHATGSIASSENPTVAGEVLSMYTTNLIEGGAIPPRVIVGDRLAQVVYFGDAPGYAGYFQVNFRVPVGATGAAVPVRLRYLDRPSNDVTIGVIAQ